MKQSLIFFRRFVLLVILMQLLQYNVYCRQIDSTAIRIENDIEKAIEKLDPEEAESEAAALIEFLQNLAADPVNINRANIDELMLIPGLNRGTATAIIKYRSENGPFESLSDLTDVSGIGSATLDRMIPYITTGSMGIGSNEMYLNRRYWLNNSGAEIFSRYRRVIQIQDGYLKPDSLGGFTGSPVNYYQRFRYRSNKISLHLIQEKDPGEALEGLSGFDYNSWHIAIQKAGKLQSFVIGDYSLSFGQGLLLWTGGSFGKSRDTVKSASRNERGVRPYTSAGEGAGFRGVAFTYGDRLQVSGFYSNRKRTASVVDSMYVRFPSQSGYHRTASELERRNNLVQSTFGGRIRYRFNSGHIGVTGYSNQFSKPIMKGDQPYQIYRFHGTTLTGYSADAGYMLNGFHFFSEAAYTTHGGFGIKSGIEHTLRDGTDAVILFRHYEKNFQSIFGAAFAELSGFPSNEQGFYTGISHRFGRSVKISTYFDQFRFPAPGFQTAQPANGREWLVFLEIFPVKKFNLYVLARNKERQEEYSDLDNFGRDLRSLGLNNRSGIRIQAEWIPLRFLRVRTRLEAVKTKPAGSSGTAGRLFFQDVRLIPVSWLKVDIRATIFKTDDYNSRVYQFENDLLYVMSNAMLYGKGHRLYAVVHLKTASYLDIWAKFATTVYDDRPEISSGNLRIEGNRRSDLGIQIRLKF
jgi:competence ComEA-like helix-hairpin-helix protein